MQSELLEGLMSLLPVRHSRFASPAPASYVFDGAETDAGLDTSENA